MYSTRQEGVNLNFQVQIAYPIQVELKLSILWEELWHQMPYSVGMENCQIPRVYLGGDVEGSNWMVHKC